MLTYSFPFCAVSDFNDHAIDAEITVTGIKLNVSATKTVSLKTQTWDNQTPVDQISIDINNYDVLLKEVEFEITVKSNKPTPILFFHPILVNNTNNFYLRPTSQKVINSNFDTSDMWYNLPLKNNERAVCILKLIKTNDSIDDVADFLKDKILYNDTLTYKTKKLNKPTLSAEENIEYYLGKDKYTNLFFKHTLPGAWDIPPRANDTSKILTNTTIYVTDKNIECKLNNLGYRSNFDYNLEELKEKKVVICLGDSDVFGAFNPVDVIWPSQLQDRLSDITILNFGIRGISGDGMTRIGVRAIEALKSSIIAVCVHWPPPALREVVSKTFKCGVHTHRNYYLPYDDWWKHIDWHSNNYNYYKNQLLLSSVCEKYSIPYYDLLINKDDPTVPYDVCRYGVYDSFGPATHAAITNYFYKKIKNQPSLFQSLQS